MQRVKSEEKLQFIHFAKCTGTGNEVSGGHHTVQCGYRNVLFQQTNSTVCGRLNEMQPNAKCCPANVNSLCAACSSCIQFCIQFALQTRQIWLELKLHWYSNKMCKSILQIRYTGDQRIDRVIRMSYKIGNVLHIKLAWWKYVVYYLYITFCTYSCKTWEFENKNVSQRVSTQMDCEFEIVFETISKQREYITVNCQNSNWNSWQISRLFWTKMSSHFTWW